MGDSQVIINWALEKAHVMSLELNHCLDKSKLLMKEFSWLSFNHIYKELNKMVDELSKLELGAMDGRIQFSLHVAGLVIRFGHVSFF